AFLRAILASPEDASVRLVYAVWLEERADGHGKRTFWSGISFRVSRRLSLVFGTIFVHMAENCLAVPVYRSQWRTARLSRGLERRRSLPVHGRGPVGRHGFHPRQPRHS